MIAVFHLLMAFQAANDRECSSSLPRMQSDGGSDEYGQNPSASHSAQSCVAVNSPSDIGLF